MEHYCVVYSLLRTALWGNDHYPLHLEENIDWPLIFKELRDHAVEGVASDALAYAQNLDLQVQMKWIHRTSKGIVFWNNLMKLQDELKLMMEQAQIPFVVLKGAAAAIYYKSPEFRKMGDIDLLVKPEDFDRAFKLCMDHGFELNEEDDGRHVELKKDQFMVELHHHFADIADPEIAAFFDCRLETAIDRLEEASVCGHRFPILPRLENGLVLLSHLDHHMETGLGLRQIIDWMLFVDKELDDRWWEEEFCQWTQKLGMHTLAVTVTKMCQMFLGLKMEGITWCSGADEKLCRDLMVLTMERGNFGRKLGDSKKAVPVLGLMSNVARIPALLQKHGCYNWKALEKYPWLKPFAWLYQLCRYIRQGLQRKHPFRKLLEDVRESKHQANVIDQLALANNTKKKLDNYKKGNRK